MEYDPNALEWLFRTFERMHHNCIKSEFARRGLSEASHPAILFSLKYEVRNMAASQKDIAQMLGISPPTVAISLKRMEKAGLVRKIVDENDLRRNLITLTDKGLQLLEECENTFYEIDRNIFNGFSDEEREQLKKFYIRMIYNLESMGVQPPAQLKRRE
ncbi:MAG: MarR family transcriptional regulator [Tepidanaerobacteraceae bacterium]|nr:MarR family transcriptional regulator [Tepidanaerobacteraceae bacterium]